MQLYLIDRLAGDQAYLTGDEARHLTKVMRTKLGERVRLMDGLGGSWVAEVSELRPKDVVCTVVGKEDNPRPASRIGLVVAPTKQFSRTERLVQFAVEIGVTDLHFIRSTRTLRPSIPMDRVSRLIKSSMKQCHRIDPMHCHNMISLPEWLTTEADSYAETYIGVLDREAPSLFSMQTMGDVAMIIGPEGDFTSDEIAACVTARCKPVQMGTFRLRTETAAIFAAMAIKIKKV